jgi:predicted NBD/HSP70 family sugar kinase
MRNNQCAGHGERNLVYIKLGIGIGSELLMDEQVFRGVTQTGDILLESMRQTVQHGLCEFRLTCWGGRSSRMSAVFQTLPNALHLDAY